MDGIEFVEEFIMAENSVEILIKTIDGMTVVQLAEAVKALQEHYGVSAMPVASAAPAAGEVAAAAEKSEYKVILENGGSEIMKVIKALRQILPNLALGDAKAAATDGNFVVAEAASKDDAKKMKETLEAAGAKVKLS